MLIADVNIAFYRILSKKRRGGNAPFRASRRRREIIRPGIAKEKKVVRGLLRTIGGEASVM